jgi:hypothetical protein
LLLESFANFYAATFPSIDPDARESLRAAVRQYGDISADFFASQPTELVAQGDVLGPLPFLFEDAEGEIVERSVFGMMVSQSCDFDADSRVLFAPAFSFGDFAAQKNANSIRANEITTLFYLPPLLSSDALVVDFRLMQPFVTERVAAKVASGEWKRVRSFTHVGWYLFLAKLTLHFLRPQREQEARAVSAPEVSERIRYALLQIPALGRYVIEGRG